MKMSLVAEKPKKKLLKKRVLTPVKDEKEAESVVSAEENPQKTELKEVPKTKEASSDAPKEVTPSPKEGTDEEAKKEKATPKVDPESESKKEPKKRNRKKNADPINPLMEQIQNGNFPKTEIDEFEEVVKNIVSPFNDKEWFDKKEALKNELNELVIPIDGTPADLIEYEAKLSHFRGTFGEAALMARNLYRQIAAKEPEGLLEQVKRVNSRGGNEQDRRANGIIGAMTYTIDGQNINLFEVANEMYARHSFYQYLYDEVESRAQTVNSMIGLYKIDASLAQRQP